jgi:tetratricopeptide (TPR) repeat protein
MQRLLVRVTCWLLCGVSSVAMAAGSWKTATTPFYTLVTQADDRESTQWMRDFDQFVLSTADLVKMNVNALPPLTVVLFADDKSYTPYKLRRPDGKAASVAGQFIRRSTWSAIGMEQDARDEELRRTIFHEATHWLMSVDQQRQPAWFSEGIAEMFSTFERKGEKVNWAKPIGQHLGLLQIGTLPLQSFLIEPTALSSRDDRQQRFYAQAWAFTYFMMFANNSQRRPLMAKFLEVFRSSSGEAAVAAVFGDQLPQIEREFHLFIDRRSFPYVTLPARAAPPPPALQPVSGALVEASLGLLALGAQRPELAQQHAERAIALDANSPRGYEILAYLAVENDNFDLAATQAEIALKRGSKDSQLYMLMGDSYVQGRNADRPNAAQARVGMYENAINLSPRRLEIYQRLVGALHAIESPREADLQFLNLGLQAFPDEDFLRVGVAMVEYRLGRRDSALATLEKVLRPESMLDASERENALNLRRSWWISSMNEELTNAASSRELEAARAAIAKYRQKLGDIPEIARHLDEVEASLKRLEPIKRKAR